MAKKPTKSKAWVLEYFELFPQANYAKKPAFQAKDEGGAMSEASIQLASEVTSELVEAIALLMPQLGGSSPPNAEELTEILASTATTLLVARVQAQIAGMTTLILVRIPTGLRAIIEDVVVDAAYRNKGVGEALVRTALELAKAKGAQRVDLTSRAARHAAHRLYERLGFKVRDTQVYRFQFAAGLAGRTPVTPP